MGSGVERAAVRELKALARKNPIAAAVVVAAVIVIVVAAGAFGAGGSAGTSGAADAAASAAGTPTPSSSSDSVLQEATAVRVVDGDTLKVRLADGTEHSVRLVGIDTPESVAGDESRNCEEGVIASDFTKSLVAPQQVIWLQRDVSDTDKYGRLLRYVWLEHPENPSDEGEIAAKMLNAVLVREGYAQVKRYKPDTTLHNLFQRWGGEAVDAGKGVTHKWA